MPVTSEIHFTGLSTAEVAFKQDQFGANVLPEKPKPSNLALLGSQLKSPLIYILLVAGLVTVLIGHFSDAAIILLAVVLNTILGFVQERKASDALYALKHYVSQTTVVVRNGTRVTIDTTQLVPGDVVMLAQGMKVPADGVLLEANRCYIDEAMLTGESVSVKKAEQEQVYMGTLIVAGQAVMQVQAIGAQTKMGAIALQIQSVEEDTPLQKQLKEFSKQLLVVVGILLGLVLVIGLAYQFSLTEVFLTSVALAVSSIPEGLLVSFTVVLAIGMQKILRRRGLVRKLAAAETLGGVTVICVDKTGTLTEGNMTMVAAVGDKQQLAEQALLANDLDDPLVIAAFEWGRTIITDFVSEHPRVDSIPFSSETRCFMSLHQWSAKQHRLYVNGAPEVVLAGTTLTATEKQAVQATIDELTQQGKRLIGLARKDVSHQVKTLTATDSQAGLTWVGILAFSDPVRPGVAAALAQARSAGIRTLVITGDYAPTAQFVLAELGITVTKDQVMTGEELAELSVAELAKKIKTVRLFARTTPTQKLNIVAALKEQGEVVAMMGDGVNDAPALHQSDIGIAVGEASDVSKESADLVLLDSNFSTITGAIEEGRVIFENIRKIILYLMSDAFSEIVVILGSILLGFPMALTAVQILWINLVSDGFPNLALTIDPVRKDIMQEKPRPTDEPLVTRWMIALISTVSLTAGLLALAAFTVVYKTSGDLVLARSMAFLTLGLNSLAYVFSVRSLMVPFWRGQMFANKWLGGAVLAGFCLQSVPFLTESTRQFFGLTYLGPTYWLVAMGLSGVMFGVVEVFKWLCHGREMGKVDQHLS